MSQTITSQTIAEHALERALMLIDGKWVASADGRLIGVPHKEDYVGLDPGGARPRAGTGARSARCTRPSARLHRGK